MPSIPDDIGRMGNFSSADFEEIKKALIAAVGDAVKFNSASKSAPGDKDKEGFEKLVKSISDLTKIMTESQEDIRENIEETKKFVEKVKEASVELKKPEKKEKKPVVLEAESVQQQILRNQQKASKSKIDKFTTGSSVLSATKSSPSTSIGDSFSKIAKSFTPSVSPSKANIEKLFSQQKKSDKNSTRNFIENIARSFSLESLGFKPKGTDKVPAMLTKGEYVMSREEAQGFKDGGFVKPKYLAKGSGGARGYRIIPELLERLGLTISPTIGDPTNVQQAESDMDRIGGNLAGRLNNKFENETKKNVAAWATGLSNMLMGGGANLLQNVFQGSVTDATEFRQDIRKLAYELEGVGKQERALQKGFFELGNVAQETGKRAEVMQRVLLSNVKKGLKNNVETKKVMKSSLYLSTMIGSNAEQTADLFGDWYRTLGMGADQMSRLANDSRLLARSTGVTGDELVAVMKASEGILKNLRNQGNLTNSAAKNVIETMAQAKKMGIEGEAGKILEAMTSTTKLFGADPKTRNFIMGMAGRSGSQKMIDAVRTGTITKDKGLMKQFSTEMDRFIFDMTGGKANNAQEAMENLSEDERANLSLQLDNFAGMDLYTYDAFGKGLSEASKSLEERLNELNKKAISPAATEEEKQAVERQKKDLLMTSAFGNLQSFSSAIVKGQESGQNFEQILQKSFDKMSQDEKDSIKTLEASLSTKEQSALKGLSDPMRAQVVSTLAANKSLQEAAAAQGKTVKDFGPEIQSALKSGDMSKYREAVAEMDKSMKEFNVNDKMAADPMTELSHSVNKLNDTIRNRFSSLTGSIIDFVGAIGIFGIQLGLMIGGFYAVFGRGASNLIGGIKKLKLVEHFDNLALEMGSGSGKGIFKNFFQTYAKSRTGGGKNSVLQSLEKATRRLGNNMRSGIFASMDALEAGAGGFFNSFRKGLTKIVIETGEFYKNLGSGFLNARKAGLGLGRSLTEGIVKGYGAFFKRTGLDKMFNQMLKRAGLSKFTDNFIKGFSRARKAGDGVLKAFSRGFMGMIKSSNKGRAFLNQLSNFGQRIRQGLPMLDSFIKGFSRATKAGDGFFKAFSRGFMGMARSATSGFNLAKLTSGISGGFTRLTTGIFNGFMGFVSSVRKIFAGGFLNGLRTILSSGVSGLSKVVSGGFRGISAAGKIGMKGLRAALLGGTMGTAQIIFTAIDTVFGAVSGFMNTGKNFDGVMKAMGKSTKDMTWGMYASSTIAGALVGILDGLTFGLLGFTGATEFLNKALSLVFYTIFSVVEGIIQGIMVPFQMVWSAIKYIGAQLKDIGDSFLEIFNSIAGLFGAKAGNWSEAFAMIYPWLKGIGMVIGIIVGGPLMAFLWALVKTISLALVPVQMLAKAISGTINVIASFVKAIGMILTGDFSGAFSLIGESIYNAVTGIFSPVINFIGSLANDIMAPFRWLYNILVGHSIIPDLCIAIVGLFGRMAINALSALGSFAFKVIKFFVKLPFKIMGAMYKAFVKWPIKLFTKLIDFLTGGLFSKGLSTLATKIGQFFSLFKKYLWDFASIAFQSWYKLLNWISGGWLDKIVKGFTSLGSKVVALVDDWLVKPLTAGFQKLAGIFDDYLIKPITGILQKLGLIKGPAAAAGWAANAAKGGAKAATAADDVAKGAAKAADDLAKGAATSADDLAKAASATAKGGATLADDAVKVAASGADDLAKAGASGLGGTAGKAVGGLAKKIPILGPLLDFGIRKAVGQDTVQAAGGAAAGAGGALAGAAAGAALGSVVPVIGTAIGGIAGGIIGGIGGGMLWDTGYEAVTGKGEKAIEKGGVGSTIVEQGDAQLAQGEIISTTMQMAQEPGSMYVHDTHVEAVLLMILESLNSGGISSLIPKEVGGAMSGIGGAIAGVGGGAITGAMIGTALMPGLGTIAGAAIGGGISAVGGMIGLGGKGKTVGKKDFTSDKISGALEGQKALETKQTQQGDIMSEALSMGREAGSGMFVHDVHCEALLYLILKQLGWEESKGLEEYNNLMKNLKESPERGLEKSMSQSVIKKKEEEAKDYIFWQGKKQKEAAAEAERLKSVVQEIDKQGKGKERAAEATNKSTEAVLAKEEITTKAVDSASDAATAVVKSSISGLSEVAMEPVTNETYPAYDPIKIPEKNPEFMKRMNLMQQEIMKNGLDIPLIPSSKSSLNLTDLEDRTANAMETSAVASSIPVGQHAIPVARTTEDEDTISNVQPVHLRDITESILRDKTSAQAGNNKLQSDELTRMEEVANQQVAELTQIKQGIQQVVSLLTPKGEVTGASPEQMGASTKDPRRPLHAAAFGKMKYARAGGLANRATVNNGEC